MIQEIMRDTEFLAQKAEPATPEDLQVAEEGCLSLTGTRKTKRYQPIKVQYQNEKFQVRLKTFIGWTAQIIQHEIDHCEGTLI